MLKLILCIILPASLCLNPLALAAESPDEQIARSHFIAKKAGEEIFYRYLIAILQQTNPWQSGLVRVGKARDTWLASGDRIRAAVENLSVYHESASSLMKSEQRMWEEMAAALDSYLENYERAVFDSRQLVRELDTASIFVRHAKEMVRLSLADIDDVCEKGIAENIQTSHMVPIKFHNPRVGFYGHVGTSTENPRGNLNGGLGPSDQAQEQQKEGDGLELFPIADKIFGDAGPTMNAVLSYGTPAFSYAALTGFQLTALYGPAASSTALLAAGGITIGIAVVLLAVTEVLNRAEARRAQDDVERVFWDRASSNDVMGYVKEACRPVRDKLKEVPLLIERLKSAKPGSPEQVAFDQRAEKAKKSLEAFKEAEAAASKKNAELEATFTGNPTGLQKAMSEAPEFKRYQQALINIGIPSLIDSLVVAQTKIGLATEDAAGSIEYARAETSDKINDLLEKNLDVLRARRHQMFVWSRELSLDNQKLPELLEFRDQGFQLTKALFKKWQSVYMSALFAYLDGRKETASLSDVLSESQAIQKQFGSNYLLEAIGRRTVAFQTFLEKEKL